MIWYAAEPYAEMSELSLHASRQTSVGCKASPSTSEAMHVQVCFTSVTSWQKLVIVELMKIVQSEKTDTTSKNDKGCPAKELSSLFKGARLDLRDNRTSEDDTAFLFTQIGSVIPTSIAKVVGDFV